ncbi:MAG: ACT domain-containing protein, partial [Clostridia bacterium]|nr:ACT domain-containing protein [Clostridia bacterium]
MIVKQLTAFLQNEPGRLEELTSVLEQEKINISALSIAETEEYGIVRMIVSHPEKAEE